MRLLLPALLLATLASCAAAPASRSVVTDLSGESVALFDGTRRGPVLLLFVDIDCPTGNDYAPEIERIHQAYAPRGVACYLVYWYDKRTVEEIRRHEQEYGLTLPVLLDFDQVLVKRTGATRIPEAAVLTADGELAYRGRIDDRYVDFGQARFEPTRHDLREALDAVLAGRLPEVARTEAVGCFITPPR